MIVRSSLSLCARRVERRRRHHLRRRQASSHEDFPVALTPLIGREREEAAIAHLLLREDVRLLTLTGPAGIGKTRLATQTALGLGAHFANVVFVSLAAISEHSLVLPAIAQALGLHDQANQPAHDQLYEYLAKRKSLLILDNFEQVAQAGPQIAQTAGSMPTGQGAGHQPDRAARARGA